MASHQSNLFNLVEKTLGTENTERVMQLMTIPSGFSVWECGWVSRKELTQALNMVLFFDLLSRVPTGRLYTEEAAARGGKVFHDHGALRTVRWMQNGALPPGEAAFTRILEPLGYRLNGIFPLDRIGMTGRSYAHADNPEEIAQFFVSELHPERFSARFQDAVTRVLSSSKDPLPPQAQCLLHELARDGRLSFADAAELLPRLKACFDRQHDIPLLSDYEILREESDEMAWIATEGNAFNHVTDRVDDLERLTREQAALGRPMKKAIEVSQSGRIRQTAFKADPVLRPFRDGQGGVVQREVPGSFYEFISRDRIAQTLAQAPSQPAALDLGFDAGNAQAIFKMTAAAR
jgi:hypothetical protein